MQRYRKFASWIVLLFVTAWVIRFVYRGDFDLLKRISNLVFFWGTFYAIAYFYRARQAAIAQKAIKAKPCSRCGYSLIGNTSGVCPECGQAFRWVCPRCKQPIAADAPRCDACGCEWSDKPA
jgi:hypothetical protein